MLLDHVDCKVLCITEHWKSESQLKQLGIKNFNLVSMFCREEGQHGGSAIFVRQKVTARNKPKLTSLSRCGVFECAAIEYRIGNVDIIVLSVYAPPSGDIKLFLNKLEELMYKISQENKHIFVTGDFNIEMIKENKTKTEFVSMMNSFNLIHTIKENTRVTPTSASCLDNIFTNSDFVKTSVIENFASDHKAQKIVFQIQNRASQVSEHKRIFSQENKDNFLGCLRDQDWENVYSINRNDVNSQWNSFINAYTCLFNQSFPLKVVHNHTNQKSKNRSPQIVECKRRLDNLLILSNHFIKYKDTYKQTKKEYDNMLKNSRIKTYENRITHSDNKMKCMWAICKEINGKIKYNNDIQIEGNAEDIANKFNNFLISVIPNILKNTNYLPHRCDIPINSRSMYLKPLTTEEICELANDIKNKHSSGIDEIPTSIIKNSIPELKEVLCFLINSSFANGCFPANLKIALIKPMFKKGDPQRMDSYRPISLLPGFSKLFELAMCRRLLKFMNDCSLFSSNQHGFLRGKSTQTAIYQFVQSVLKYLENGEAALGMFLDLSKAYDCLDRGLLVKKLQRYGIRGNTLKWLTSYLNERTQIVGVNKRGEFRKSKMLFNDSGIAQGSILGPILFVIFINDIYSVTDRPGQTIINYADDTNLLTGHKTTYQLLIDSKHLLSKTSNWFTGNRLTLNSEKTSLIFFRTKQSKLEKIYNLDLTNINLPVSENTKFLGLYINENLDWNFHISKLLKKLGSVCYGIRVVSRYMNEQVLKIMYYANFESILKYGIIFWGRDSSIQNTFVVQKRLLRIIKKMEFNQSCRTSFRVMRIMTVYALYIFECIMFVHRNRNLFEPGNSSQYNTRTNHLRYPTHRLQLTERSPEYMCVKCYNKLPTRIKRIEGQRAFKREVRNMLIQLEPYVFDDYFNM